MPWLIAIMVALTVLAAGGALSLANFASGARSDLESGITILLVEGDIASRDQQIDRVLAKLAGDPGVANVRRVPESEIEELVEPWLGGATSSDAIVLPALVDASLAGQMDRTRLERLRSTIQSIAPGAHVDAQASWLGPVFSALGAVRWLAVALIGLLTFASVAAVWLAARNALDANRETIEIVHHLGGNDSQIAAIFQRSVLVDAILGGALGMGLGLAALLLIGSRFAELQSGLVGESQLGPLDWMLIAVVPIATAGVAVVTARRTVLSRLGTML